VLAEVEKDIGDRISDFAGRRQRACVVAIAPDPADPGDAFDRQGDADDESSNAFRQVIVTVGLDDRMHVILLHREMQNAKRRVDAAGDRIANGGEESDRAQRGQVRCGP